MDGLRWLSQNLEKTKQMTRHSDTQIGGTHYLSSIQAWDYILANELGYLEGNIIKYVTRHRKKNGVQDLEKALHYLQKLIETENDRLRAALDSGGSATPKGTQAPSGSFLRTSLRDGVESDGRAKTVNERYQDFMPTKLGDII